MSTATTSLDVLAMLLEEIRALRSEIKAALGGAARPARVKLADVPTEYPGVSKRWAAEHVTASGPRNAMSVDRAELEAALASAQPRRKKKIDTSRPMNDSTPPPAPAPTTNATVAALARKRAA